MRIKAFISSINKNLFFSLGFVVFTGMVLLFNWLFSLPAGQSDAILGRLAGTGQQISRLGSIQAEFVLRAGAARDLFADEKTLTLKDLVSEVNAIRGDLLYYGNHRLLSGNKRVTGGLHEMEGSLDRFEADLKDLIMASQERGDENTGLIYRWHALSTKMAEASRNNGPAVQNLMEKLQQLETRYALYRNPEITGEIASLAGEVRNALTEKTSGIVLADLDNYLAMTTGLAALDRRIGTSGSQGIAARSAGSLEQLRSHSMQVRNLVSDAMTAIRTRWTVIRYLVITLFTIACIFFLILVTSSGITRPLVATTGYLEKLAAGELPGESIVPGGLREIRMIDDLLNRLTKGLKDKAILARSLNENKTDVKINPAGEGDILGQELLSLQRKMAENAALQKKNDEENARRRYINEGLAKFAEILRTRSNNIQDLGDVFIREAVKYLGAIQGGLFLYNERESEEPVIELVSAFAYNRKKYMQRSLLPGEGLVGTCALEKQIIHLTEIPEDYITITSGLGDTRPDNLLLVPVLHENDLIGVMEIASLKRFQEHEIRFAGEVAGSLGATIDYARNNQRTADLLAKSQQQAQRMAEQEEEMRQNMEELKSTQEESSRREQGFRMLAHAVGSAFYMMEYNLDGTVRLANNKLSTFLGRHADDFPGRTHHEILNGTLKPDEAFWDTLKKKKQVSLVEKVKIGKKEYMLKEHFSAVMRQDDTLSHFACFLTEINP